MPLEVTDQSIFSQIDKIEKSDDRYFILDKALLRRVLVFDDNGKFLYDIGDLGGARENILKFRILLLIRNREML